MAGAREEADLEKMDLALRVRNDLSMDSREMRVAALPGARGLVGASPDAWQCTRALR